MLATAHKYASIAKINFLNTIAYAMEYASSTIFMIILMFVFIQLWRVIYASSEGIPGFTYVQMIWYLVLAESISFSGRRIAQEISHEVKSGSIAYQLNKPYNYVIFRYFDFLAAGLFRFAMTFIAGTIIALAFVGPFDFDFAYAPYVLLAVLFAITMNFMFNMLIGLLSFWFEDVDGFEWVYGKFVLIIGGVLLPFEIFPGWIAKIISYLPFSTVGYYPAKLFAAPHLQHVSSIYLFQIAWIIIMIGVLWIAYTIGTRKVNIHGG